MGGAEQSAGVPPIAAQLWVPVGQRRLQGPLAWGGGSILEVGTCPFWGPPRGGHPPFQVLFSLTKMLFQLVWVGKRLGNQCRACPNSKAMSVNASGANWPEQRPALGVGLRGAVHPGWGRSLGSRPGRHGRHPPTRFQLQCSEDR